MPQMRVRIRQNDADHIGSRSTPMSAAISLIILYTVLQKSISIPSTGLYLKQYITDLSSFLQFWQSNDFRASVILQANFQIMQ